MINDLTITLNAVYYAFAKLNHISPLFSMIHCAFLLLSLRLPPSALPTTYSKAC